MDRLFWWPWLLCPSWPFPLAMELAGSREEDSWSRKPSSLSSICNGSLVLTFGVAEQNSLGLPVFDG